MTAPCFLDTWRPPPGRDWPGSPCLLERWLCVTCGDESDLPWAAMAHEDVAGRYAAERWRASRHA